MSLESDTCKRKALETSASVYDDIYKISQTARAISNASNGAVIHSASVSYAVSGIVPTAQFLMPFEDRVECSTIMEQLSYISDDSIKQSILRSFRASKERGVETFCYCKNMHDGKKARVRIITRKLLVELGVVK